MDKAFLLLVRNSSPHSDEVIPLLVTLFSPPNSKGKLITFESSNTYSYSMALFTLGEYTIKAVQQVGRQLKMLTQPIPSAVERSRSYYSSPSFSPLMKGMLRRKSQPYGTTIK